MKLVITQDQRQIISPALIQTLELVMLPAAELKEKIEEEARQNPVIKLEKKKADHKQRTKKQSGFDSQAFLENLSVYDKSLYRYMMEQVNSLNMTEQEVKIAQIILSSLHENGLLQEADEKGVLRPVSVAKLLENTDITLQEFEEVRQRLLYLDPIGAASYNTQEYLKVQASEKFGKKSLEYRILNECLESLEKKLYTKIAKDLKTDYDKVTTAIESITHLNLTPGYSLSGGYPQYIIPDAFVNVTQDGISLVLNDEYIPDVKLNKYCVDLYEKGTRKVFNSGDKSWEEKQVDLSRNEKYFFKENIDKANALIDSLHSRKEIIFKVISKIVEKQKDFFLRGPEWQIPLKLKDIADEINVHESTVSRVVRDKYIQTNKGIINLKSFFSTNIGSGDTSANTVRQHLKAIVDAEDKDDPLSDDRIVQILKKKGIAISRRTVAKYRSELDIPPAFMRRNPI